MRPEYRKKKLEFTLNDNGQLVKLEENAPDVYVKRQQKQAVKMSDHPNSLQGEMAKRNENKATSQPVMIKDQSNRRKSADVTSRVTKSLSPDDVSNFKSLNFSQ